MMVSDPSKNNTLPGFSIFSDAENALSAFLLVLDESVLRELPGIS
ncbi:hypothetical protein [Alistipes finegoldii]|nr:hypothetical protein [Alistipes finegoldii]